MLEISKFIKECSLDYFNEETSNIITNAKEKKLNLDEIIREWEQVIKKVCMFFIVMIIESHNFCLKEVTEYAQQRCASDSELFATAYHKMVHSPALETMLQLEYMYSRTVRQKAEEKKRLIQELSER